LTRRPIITLTTDFGTGDHFVGTMKGVILSINPEVDIVDLCHEVASYDIFDAAFTLAQSYRYFPSYTIHVMVVDPGVGTARRPILGRSMKYHFVAPDNGVLSLIFEREENMQVRHITSDHFFLNPVSNTFHGRDVFAPVAGWLSKGVESDKFGDLITDFVKFTAPKPKRLDENLIKGIALKIDKFGNIITNITPDDVPQLFSENPPPFRFVVNQKEITRLNLAYSLGHPSEVFAIVGSSGFIEISSNRGSAAKTLNAERGMEVGVVMGGSPSSSI
jgi:S-adenosylmethionine hydrolase